MGAIAINHADGDHLHVGREGPEFRIEEDADLLVCPPPLLPRGGALEEPAWKTEGSRVRRLCRNC